MGPTVIQLLMEKEYKIIFLNSVIGKANYQQGGLTKMGRKLRISNPRGMMEYCCLNYKLSNSFFLRLKHRVFYEVYLLFFIKKTKTSQYINSNINFNIFYRILALPIFNYYKIKYGDNLK